MIIKNPQFEVSAVSPKQYPKNNLPEIVLVGKSNVGKSSFVNTMINRKKLARTSSEPGKTRQINFYNMDEDEFYNMLLMYKDRYSNLIKDEKVQYVSIFKNYLRQAGASLNHPHSQIVSISIIPPDIEREINISKQYYIENKRYLYDNIINEEIKEKERVINNSESFLTLVPKSTKYTGEIRILFKKNIKFENICNKDIRELSIIFKNLFSNLFKVNGNLPFNIFIHSHPKNIEGNYFNVHIHIIPRKYSFGGFELGTGLYVSSIEPKDIANKIKF